MADSTIDPQPASPLRSPNTQLTSRRVSFRMSISDAALPPEYLEALEQKRKQLDDSIHKYIAGKEREYRAFERDLKAQLRGQSQQTRAGQQEGLLNGSMEGKRRTSSESTTLSNLNDATTANAAMSGNGQGSIRQARAPPAVEALLVNGARRDSDALEDDIPDIHRRAEIAGLTDRRASVDRDKEFVGLFTPPYLAALDDSKAASHLDRTASAPALVEPSVKETPATLQVPAEFPRANSDSVVAKAKRPIQLQETSRTSSSGSSADGRLALASALKSPTQKERPQRKRVSLALGDTIVAPSDNVPLTMTSNNHAPSHSRVRSPPKTDAEEVVTAQGEDQSLDSRLASTIAPLRPDRFADSTPPVKSSSTTMPGPGSKKNPLELHTLAQTANDSNRTPPAPQNSKSTIDADGDLFDLEEDSDGELISQGSKPFDVDESALDADDMDDLDINHAEADIATAMGHEDGAIDGDENYSYDRNIGLIVSTGSSPEEQDTATAAGVQLEFRPGSLYASRQPTEPGFRRPSVSRDPVFIGSGYAAEELKAAKDGIYGSKYVSPGSKGSYVGGAAGSLGESFMEKNAAELMKRRAQLKANAQGAVRS